MKSRQILQSSVRCLLPIAAALIASSASTSAEELQWDADTATAGAQDGAGTWNSTSTNWYYEDPFAPGNGTNVAWENDGSWVAAFGSGGATGARTINVSGDFHVAGMFFEPPFAYTLQGGSIQIADGGEIIIDNASQAGTMLTFNTVLKGNNITLNNIGTNGEQYISLGGANTWTGNLTITGQGTNGRLFVRASNSGTLNTLTSIDVSEDSTLSLVGAGSTYTPAITIAGRGDGNRGALRMDQSMTLTGRITLSGDASISTQDSGGNASTVTLTSGIGETLGSSFNLTKSGTGNLIIAAASNYTGQTIVGPTGTTRAGTLTLDFSHANAPATNLLYNGVAANTLKLVGTNGTPTFSVTGKDAVTNSQTFAGVEVTGEGIINATSGAGGTLNLNLGEITRGTSGSTLTITAPSTGTITASNSGVVPWVNYVGATVTGWAEVKGGTLGLLTRDLTYASGAEISSLAGYGVNSNMEITDASTGNVLQGAGTTQLSTITMADATAARTIDLGAGKGLRFGNNGGIQMLSGANQLTVGSAPGVGSITAGGELFLTNRSAESLVINSVVTDNGGAVKVTVNGSGRVQFSGANNYSGATTISSGILQIDTNTGLGTTGASTTIENGGTLALAGNLSNLAEDISLVGNGAGNGGAIRNISGNNIYTGLISLGGVSRINSDAGKLIFSASSPTSNVISGGNSVTFGGAGTTEIRGRFAVGGGGLTKDGTGMLILSGSNSYSNVTTVNTGTLLITNPAALGTSSTTTTTGTVVNSSGTLALAGGITTQAELLTISGANFNGSLRNLSGNNTYAGAITMTGSTRIHADAGTTLTLDVASGNAITNSGTTRTLAFGGAGDVVVKDPIAHTGSNTLTLLKDGIGTLTLQATNNYATTGNTTTVNSGKLVLDYSSSNAVLNSSQTITLGGGTLEVKGGAATSSPTIGNLSLTAFTGISTLKVGSNTTLTVGDTWTRTSASMMLVDISAPGSVLKSNPNNSTADNGEKGLLLGTGGSNASFVIKDPTGYDFAAVKSGTVTRLAATTALPSSGGSGSSSYVLNANGATTALTGNLSSSTVRVDTNANSGILDLAGRSLTLQRLGLLVDGANDFTITDSTGGGVLRGGGTDAVFLFHYGTGKVTVDAALSDNVGGPDGQVFLVGTGLIDWKSTSNNAGNNYIQGVTARVSNGAIDLTNTTTGNGTGSLVLTQGGILELVDADLTRDIGGGAGRINMSSGGSAGDGGGFSAYGADRFVNLQGGATLSWGGSGFLAQGRKLILGSPHANAVVDFRNNLNLAGGIQTVEVQSINQVGIGGKISGDITGVNGGFAKIGPGLLTLSGTSDYTGTTSVLEGTLEVTGVINGTSILSVAGGAKLKARGTGSVTAGSYSLLDGSEIDLELGATTATTLIAGDNFSLDGDIKLSLALTADPLDGTLFTLLDGSGLLAGYESGARFSFNSSVLNEGASFLVSSNGFDQMFQISYLGGGGADVTLLAVPEPSTGAALLSSMGLLLGLNRFRRRSARQVLQA